MSSNLFDIDIIFSEEEFLAEDVDPDVTLADFIILPRVNDNDIDGSSLGKEFSSASFAMGAETAPLHIRNLDLIANLIDDFHDYSFPYLARIIAYSVDVVKSIIKEN